MDSIPAARPRQVETVAPQHVERRTILLVGNPNVGKSVIFGFLTGRYVTVSNYPGTTVEISRGRLRSGGCDVIDLPGTNSLLPASQDEEVTRDFLLERLGDAGAAVVQVCDTKNLRRGLGITIQLAELERPTVVVANMLDEARSRGLHLEVEALRREIGVEVIAAVARRGEGLAPLLSGSLETRVPSVRVGYGPAVEQAVARIGDLLPAGLRGKRGVALMVLAGDDSLVPWAEQALGGALAAVQRIQEELARSTPESVRVAISRARMRAADRIARRVLLRDAVRAAHGRSSGERHGTGQDPHEHAAHGYAGGERDLHGHDFHQYAAHARAARRRDPHEHAAHLHAARERDSHEPDLGAAEPTRHWQVEDGRALFSAETIDLLEPTPPPPRRSASRWLGDLAIHPVWGLPVAAAVLYLTYLFVGVLGAGRTVDLLEGAFARWLVPAVEQALRLVLPGRLETLLVGAPGGAAGAGPGLLIGDYGLVSMGLSYAVAIVLPIVAFFFVAFSIMEDSGYLPRLAVVLNRGFRLIGLNGKAVLPMMLGLGCGTMATMTARVLPTRRERVLVTLLLALGVPCSAQLGVILGMLAGLSLWGALVWGGTVAGVMLLVALIAGKLLPGGGSDFVLEIPPIRRPQLVNVLLKTLARVEWYFKEAVPLFLLGTLVLWVLDRLHALAALQRLAAPVVVGLLGLPRAASDAFLIGFLRRDYGAAGLFALFRDALSSGSIPVATEIQVVVSMITMTLFVPCIANVLMIARERGLKTAAAVTAFVFPFALLTGGLVNLVLRAVLL